MPALGQGLRTCVDAFVGGVASAALGVLQVEATFAPKNPADEARLVEHVRLAASIIETGNFRLVRLGLGDRELDRLYADLLEVLRVRQAHGGLAAHRNLQRVAKDLQKIVREALR